MKTLQLALIMFFISVFCSCVKQGESDKEMLNKKQNDSLAVVLNNEAIMILQNATEDSSINVAKNYFIKSINLSKSSYLAYANLASALIKQNKRDSAIYILEQISNIKSNYAEGISMQGCIYEKLGKYDSANSKYASAIIMYDKRIENDESDINARVNKIFLIMLLHGSDTAIGELNKLLIKYPNHPSVLMMRDDILSSFDRKEFLKSY